MSETIKVMFIDVEGDGDVQEVNVPVGTTAEDFFIRMKGSNANPESYTIRVNRQGAEPSQILTDNCRFTLSPAKIEGA